MIKPERLYKIEGPDPQDFLLWRKGSGPTLEIYDLHVCNAHRRQGVGRTLVRHLLDNAPHWLPGCTLVWAITRTDNWVAQQFYEELRFRVVGVLRGFYGDNRLANPPDNIDAVLYGHAISPALHIHTPESEDSEDPS